MRLANGGDTPELEVDAAALSEVEGIAAIAGLDKWRFGPKPLRSEMLVSEIVSTRSERSKLPPVRERIQTSPKRGEARTQAILDATIELLTEVGFDRMTMDTVALRAKASKATIYRYWPDKTALVLDALRSRGSLVPDLADTGSLRGDLELYVRASAAATAGVAGRLAVGLLAVASRDPELASLLTQQFHYEQLPAIAALIDRARERHEISPDVDPLVISEALPGTLIMHLLVLGLPGDDPFVHRLVDDVLMPILTAEHHRPAKTNRASRRRRNP